MLTIKQHRDTMIAVCRTNGDVIARTVKIDTPESHASLERWIERYNTRKGARK